MQNIHVIAVSGTPGTGKSTFAREFTRRLDYKLIDLNKVVEENGIYELDSDDTMVVDPEDLADVFDKIFSKETKNLFIDGHLSYLLTDEQVDDLIVLRTNPNVLRKRLRKRNYSNDKLSDNLESEALGVILGEAIQIHDVDKIYEIDTTNRSPSETVDIFIEALRGNLSLKVGKIDWLKDFYG